MTRAQTAQLKATFLERFAATGNVLQSAQAAGAVRRTVYRWLDDDEQFKARFEEAERDAIDNLVAEAHRRAYQGVMRKKFTGRGEPVLDSETGQQYVELEHSDTLMIFLLKGLDPKRFRDKIEQDVTLKGGVQIYLPDRRIDVTGDT